MSARSLIKMTGLAAAIALVPLNAATAQTVQRKPLTQLHVVSGAQLGVSVRDVETADVTREKLTGLSGAYLENVRSGGPAEKAGFKTGDVVTSFDGERVRSASQFLRLIDETPDAREVEVVVMRAGQPVTLKVSPENAWSPFYRALSQTNAPMTFSMPNRALTTKVPAVTNLRNSFTYGYFAGSTALGASVQEISGQLGEYFGAPTGLLVTSIEDGSVAKTAGLKAGDVITKINGTAVTNMGDLRRNLSGDVTITIIRDRKEQTIKATIK